MTKAVQRALHCPCGREKILANGLCASCYTLKRQDAEYFGGLREAVLERDGYSATKIAWILANVPGARADAEQGKLAFGTVDTWLIWNLTNGQRHITDRTNAAVSAMLLADASGR